MSVLSPAEVRTWLSIKDTGNDDLINQVIAQAEAWTEEECGPLSPSARTVVCSGGGDTLVLPFMARQVYGYSFALTVGTVTSKVTGVNVVPDWVDDAAGVLHGSFPDARYTVLLSSAGWTTLPPNLKRGVVERCRYLWRSQRGPAAGQGDPSEMAAFNQAETLIAPYRMPGFA